MASFALRIAFSVYDRLLDEAIGSEYFPKIIIFFSRFILDHHFSPLFYRYNHHQRMKNQKLIVTFSGNFRNMGQTV
ncbi:hypothetical protein L1887_23173 [Cichorium endivia]|nr:hypothetical protein L1887_23173 [Cichorium endivia]